MGEHKNSHIFCKKPYSKTILKIENTGQIYHKQKIHEILNCDMIQALEKDF